MLRWWFPCLTPPRISCRYRFISGADFTERDSSCRRCRISCRLTKLATPYQAPFPWNGALKSQLTLVNPKRSRNGTIEKRVFGFEVLIRTIGAHVHMVDVSHHAWVSNCMPYPYLIQWLVGHSYFPHMLCIIVNFLHTPLSFRTAANPSCVAIAS